MYKYQHTILKFLTYSILLFLLNSAYAQENSGFIWEVKSSHNTLYLMGSIHFANPDFYPLRHEIETAFSKSDHLAVEVDIANIDPIQTQSYLFRVGTYTGNETIRDHIDASTYKLLIQHLTTRNLPSELFIKYKPGMIIMSLTSLEIMNLGLSPNQGIDVHFLNRARGKKKIVELETLEQQLDLLLNLDESGQMLRQTLAEFDDYPELMKSLTDIWQRGDAAQLDELLIKKPLREFPDSRPAFEKIFLQRNLKMAKKIEGFLHSNNNYFVVVGAGHLVGERSIVDLLQKAGFQIKQL